MINPSPYETQPDPQEVRVILENGNVFTVYRSKDGTGLRIRKDSRGGMNISPELSNVIEVW